MPCWSLSDLKVIFDLFRFTFPDFRIPCVCVYVLQPVESPISGGRIPSVACGQRVCVYVYNLNKVAF